MNENIQKALSFCRLKIAAEIEELHVFNRFDPKKISEIIDDISKIYFNNLLLNEPEINFDDFKSIISESFEEKKAAESAKSHDIEPWLDSAWRNNDKIRFECYKRYLTRTGKLDLIEQIEADTFEILDNCHNPNDPETNNMSWDRRGLVYGHVQSGKTANYVGLINRAFDVGYKVIIVLTGITEDLRRQTQERIDYGVLGILNGEWVGIGKDRVFQDLNDTISCPTSSDSDLSRVGNLDTLVGINHKSIWVIKKNKTVLENLISWLNNHSNRQDDNYQLQNTPFLIIDDEADNASIQSMSKSEFNLYDLAIDLELKEELSETELDNLEKAKKQVISTINKYIRVSLSLISQKTFIAYTATPYSVINQNEFNIKREDITIKGRNYRIDRDSQLFPKHFITPLNPSTTYMGIDKIFGDTLDDPIPVLTNINESFSENIDEIFVRSQNQDYTFTAIPDSLSDAIIYFLITIYVRSFRDQHDYNSMLIHTSHLTSRVDYLANKIDKFITNQKNLLEAQDIKTFKKYENALLKIKASSLNPIFKIQFGNDRTYLTPDKITINDILSILTSENQPLEVVSYHSSKSIIDSEGNARPLKHNNRNLNYKSSRDPKEKLRNYIVVGGNRLSRGLTLEGLTTSYFVRSSSRMDSLYQMGRWFGYRKNYEDLIQIYLDEKHIEWYRDICKLEHSLRNDLNEMNERQIEPREWSIKMSNNQSLATIQAKLKICDPLKLQNTQQMHLSFSGTSIYTRKISLENIERHCQNFNLFKLFIESLLENNHKYLVNNTELIGFIKTKKIDQNINLENVEVSKVLDFFQKLYFHVDENNEFNRVNRFLRTNEEKINSFSIVIKQKISSSINPEPEWILGNSLLKNKQIQKVHGIVRSPRKPFESNGDLVFEQLLDSDLDNTFDIINTDEIYEFYNQISNGSKKHKHRHELRKISKKAILIIYLTKYEQYFLPLFYLTIPGMDGVDKVTYIVRKNR
ncbi:Z1 domain-containing protein [Aquirufa sp. A-Brett2-W8]